MNYLFISEMLPINSSASEVIFYRHLKKLYEEGHTIHLLTDQNSYCRKSDQLSSIFILHLLPNRKWYYPPYRPTGVFQKIRFLDYYYLYVKNLLNRNKIDHLIGFIYSDFLAPFSAFVQEKSKLPMTSFLHDDPLELHIHKCTSALKFNVARVMSASKNILVVSETFHKNWPEFESKFKMLYPIPETHHPTTYPEQKPGLRSFGYSGTIYNELVNPIEKTAIVLEKLNIGFKLIGDNKRIHVLLQNIPSLEHIPSFKTAEEANAYLVCNCSACIIPYPLDPKDMPWIQTCFPSKFIQYCQLNLPTIIIAPAASALGKWCIQHNWLLYTDSYEPSSIEFLIKHVLPGSAVKKQVERFRENEFNPEKIHQLFSNYIAFD